MVGRSRKCDVTLSSQALDISGRHLLIIVAGDHVEVENLGRHGTRVEGVVLTAPDVIRDGQHLTLAKSTEILLEKVEGETPPPVLPTPPTPARDTDESKTPDSISPLASLDADGAPDDDEPDSMLGFFGVNAPAPPPSPPEPPAADDPSAANEEEDRFSILLDDSPPLPEPDPADEIPSDMVDIPSGFIDIQIGPDDSDGGEDPASAPPSSFRGAAISFDAGTNPHSSPLDDEPPDEDGFFEGLSDLDAHLESPPTVGPAEPKTHGISPEAVDYLRGLQRRKEIKTRIIVGVIALVTFGILVYVVMKF